MPVYSAGSASVQIVPDFTGAQKAIGEWFARQGDLHVKIHPDIDNGELLAVKAKLHEATTTEAKIEVDEEHLARSIGKAIEEAIRSLSTVDVLNDAVQGAIVPSMLSVLVGGLTEVVASASQVIGLLNLIPAGIMGLAAPIATVMLGVHGMTQAFKVFSATTPAQLKQAQAALDKLAPSAREFVMQVHELAPAFTALRLDIQQRLFEGLGTAVLQLGHVGLPVVRTGLAGIASSLNTGLLATLHALTGDSAQFTTIFANINAGGRTLAGTMAPLVQLFVRMASVGSQFLPQLATGFATLAGRFETWMNSALKTGTFVKDIQQAIQVVDVLGQIVEHLASGLNAIIQTAIPFGDMLLGLLDKITGQLSAFLHSTDAQNGLTSFFGDVNKVAQTLLPVLLQVAQVLVADVLPVIGDLAAAIAPVIGELGSQLAETVAHITEMLPPLAEVIASLIEGMQPLIPVLGQIVETLLPPFLVVGKQLGPVIDQLARICAGILLQAAQALAPALSQVGTAFLHILAALWPIVRPLGEIVTSLLPPLLQIVEALLPPLSVIIGSFARLATTLLTGLLPVIRGLAQFLSDVLVPVIHFLGPALPIIVDAFIAWQVAVFALHGAMALIKWAQWIGFLVQYAFQVGIVGTVTDVWTAATTALGVAMDFLAANPVVLLITAIVAAVIAVGVAIYELVTHWKAVWGAITTAAQWAWDNVLHPVFDAIGTAWNAVADAVSTAWNVTIKAVWNALTTAASWMWDNVLRPVFSAISTAWHALGVAFGWVWDNVIHPVWVVIADAGKVLAAILGVVVFGPIALAWKAMSIVFPWVWDHVIKPVWDAIETAARWLYQNVLLPIWHGMQDAWRALGDAVRWVNDNVIQPTWDLIKLKAQQLWDGLKVIWGWIQDGWHALGTGIKWVYDNVILPVWHALETAANWLWNNVLHPVFDAIGKAWNGLMTGIRWVYDHVVHPMWGIFEAAIGGLKSAFSTAVDWIGRIWHGIEAVVARPINFVINTILDNGLFKAWNWIVDTLHLSHSWKLWVSPIPGFADGGFTGRGMNGTYGRNDPAGVVHAGEFVVNQEQTAKHLPLLMAINSGLAGYADGGFVGWLGKAWNSVTDVFGSLTDSIAGPVKSLLAEFGSSPFEQFLAKLPEQLVGDMWNTLKGKIGSAFHAIVDAFTTGSTAVVPASRAANVAAVRNAAAAYGWSTGAEWNALVNVLMRESGFNNVAQNPTSTAFGMFQFLDGTWGAYGPKTSNPDLQARYGMEYMAGRYHDPIGAWQHELHYGWYDQGGYLPPGWTTVFNGTGRPEPVLTAAQNDALMRAAGFGWGGAARGGPSAPLVGQLNIHEASDPRAVMDEFWYDLRVASRGGVYSVAGAR